MIDRATIWTASAAALMMVATHGITAWWFYGAGRDAQIAEESRTVQAIEAAKTEARNGTAEALSKLEIQHVTVTQKAQQVIREVPVYRDCLHSDGMLDLINAARGYGNGGSSVPASGPDH